MASKADESAPKLRVYTIFADPLDAPGRYVVRGFSIERGQSVPDVDAALADSLEQARGLLPPGLFCLGRDASDHPSVVESWI